MFDNDSKAKILLALGYGPTKDIFSQYLDTVGDGSGTINAIGNYATPTDFKIAPSASEKYNLTRIIITITDNGSLDTGSYGNGVTLTNGIEIIKKIDGVETPLSAQKKIFVNPDWGSLCYDVSFFNQGSGQEFLLARYTFNKSGGNIVLDGDNGDELIVRLNDNFSTLLGHYFLVQGYKE